jgi:hypothetical protein
VLGKFSNARVVLDMYGMGWRRGFLLRLGESVVR